MPDFDLLIQNGLIYDGSGNLPFKGDVAVTGDLIVTLGSLKQAAAKNVIDARDLAVAPGFINVNSHAFETLLVDGRSLSDIKQGVTLEIFGEGLSAGPLNERMKQEIIERQTHIKYPITWTTLSEALDQLAAKGVSVNIGSFVGFGTVRIHTMGYDHQAPSPGQLNQMKLLVDQAMREGAFGLASALLYAPSFYAGIDELVELCKVVAKYDGLYISHIRNEANGILDAIDEFIMTIKTADVRGQIYHLKTSGTDNSQKLDQVIQKIETAREEGIPVTTDCYTYTAAATNLTALLPSWVHEGGIEEMVKRLKEPDLRIQIESEILDPTGTWENIYLDTGPDGILLDPFGSEKYRSLTGKSLLEVSEQMGKSPIETLMDLIIECGGLIDGVYFLMSEDNVRKKIQLPYMTFGSDERSLAPEGVFLKQGVHPRAYGNFARLLGYYCREERLLPLQEAIRKLTSLPAQILKISKRGILKEGFFADIVIFDPGKIKDTATFENPHQLAAGMINVFVNGGQVLENGEHTGVAPGRVIKGPGTGN